MILNKHYINQTGTIITPPVKPEGAMYIVRLDTGRAVLFDKVDLYPLEPEKE